jgi:hypothetical protein
MPPAFALESALPKEFSSFGNAWMCACGHAVEGNDVAHTSGCNRLSGLMQNHVDDIAEVLREFVSHLGFSASSEGRYS